MKTEKPGPPVPRWFTRCLARLLGCKEGEQMVGVLGRVFWVPHEKRTLQGYLQAINFRLLVVYIASDGHFRLLVVYIASDGSILLPLIP